MEEPWCFTPSSLFQKGSEKGGEEQRLTWKEGAAEAPMVLDYEMHSAKLYIRYANVEIFESPKTSTPLSAGHLMERGQGVGGSDAAR